MLKEKSKRGFLFTALLVINAALLLWGIYFAFNEIQDMMGKYSVLFSQAKIYQRLAFDSLYLAVLASLIGIYFWKKWAVYLFILVQLIFILYCFIWTMFTLDVSGSSFKLIESIVFGALSMISFGILFGVSVISAFPFLWVIRSKWQYFK